MHANLGPLPEPDGWIYDGHPDGLQFRRQAITGIEALARSSAPMFAAHQMRAYAAQELAAERERWEAVVLDGWRVLKGLDEAAAKRTSHQNVSDTLDALMRVLRA